MILCSGVFDGLHIGHVGYLQAAHRLDLNEALVVAVASDGYVQHWKSREPRYPLEDRMRVVHALDCVTRVIAHDATGVASLIRELAPAWFVKGRDWQGCLTDDVQAACQAVGTRLAFVDSGSQVHTSDALPAIVPV